MVDRDTCKRIKVSNVLRTFSAELTRQLAVVLDARDAALVRSVILKRMFFHRYTRVRKQPEPFQGCR